MSEFNISSYLKEQYLIEAGESTTQSTSLAKLINSSIKSIDDSMSYKDFAQAVAKVLIDDYGQHLFNPFMEVLHSKLGINESLTDDMDEEQLGKDFEDNFNVDAYSRMLGDVGKLTIQVKEDIDEIEFESMISFIQERGYRVDKSQSNSWYDVEPGERIYYPSIKYSK